jgi:hypothetical protein
MKFKNFLKEKDMYAILKHHDLTKRSGERIPIFMKKIKDREEFLTKKGSVIIKPPPPEKQTFSKKGYTQDFDTMKNGKIKYPGQFFKTPDLGGKGVGFSTRDEDRELGALQKSIEDQMKKDKTGVIKMIVGGRRILVTGVASTYGNPKSDFHLLDDEGKEAAWISHKDWKGRGPRDFQQYGGLSHAVFKNNADVQSFMKELTTQYPKGFNRGDGAFRLVKDKKVALQSVWGVDYGKARGRNNVDEFHQGPMSLKKATGDYYRIVSKHYDVNGKLPKGGYTCIYYARYTGDRGARIAGYFIKDARIGVFTQALPPKTAKRI